MRDSRTNTSADQWMNGECWQSETEIAKSDYVIAIAVSRWPSGVENAHAAAVASKNLETDNYE